MHDHDVGGDLHDDAVVGICEEEAVDVHMVTDFEVGFFNGVRTDLDEVIGEVF